MCVCVCVCAARRGADSAAADMVRRGYLEHWEGSFLKTWKTRWFVLSDSTRVRARARWRGVRCLRCAFARSAAQRRAPDCLYMFDAPESEGRLAPLAAARRRADSPPPPPPRRSANDCAADGRRRRRAGKRRPRKPICI